MRYLNVLGWAGSVALVLALTGCAQVADRATQTCTPPSGYVPIPLVADPQAPKAPKPVKRAALRIPMGAVGKVTHADVRVAAHVTEAGTVSQIDLLDEQPRGCGFAEATIASVTDWRFEVGNAGVFTVTASFKLPAR